MIRPSKHVATDGTTTYKVRFRHGHNDAGKPKQRSETFATKKAADAFSVWIDRLGVAGALEHLYDIEAAQVDTTPTLDAIAADHIALLTGIEPGTRATYERMWERIWSPRVGHLAANRITADDIRRAVNQLGDTYSHKSMQNQRGLLSGVLSRAVDLGHLPKNPVKGIRLPRGQEADRVEMRIITPAEFADLIDHIPAHYRPFVRFLYGTGCRWGEAVALQVQDVALPNVRIRRALKWTPDGPRIVGATKTKRSNRTVVVGDVMLEDLREACEGKAGTALVFTAPRGGGILHRTFWSRAWLPAVNNMTPRPRIHDLRHSHASVLLAAGVPIHVVQARLGHESIQTTVNTYSHLLPDAQVAAAAAADLAFGVRPRELR